MATRAVAIQTGHAALYAIREYCHKNRNDVAADALWNAETEAQKPWLAALAKVDPNYRAILGKRLKSFGSPSKDECNAFLAKEGFPDVQLDEFQGLNPVGGVGILHSGVEWEFAGNLDDIWDWSSGSNTCYPAALLRSGVSYLKSPHLENPIARVNTKSGEHWYFAVADKELDGVDLLDRVVGLQATAAPMKHAYYEGLLFPFIDVKVKCDISSWIGMTLPRTVDGVASKPYEIFQALKQVNLKMNHLGAQADAAVAVQAGIESGPSYLTMHKAFFAWQSVPGLSQPPVAFYLDKDAWKDPGEIKFNNG